MDFPSSKWHLCLDSACELLWFCLSKGLKECESFLRSTTSSIPCSSVFEEAEFNPSGSVLRKSICGHIKRQTKSRDALECNRQTHNIKWKRATKSSRTQEFDLFKSQELSKRKVVFSKDYSLKDEPVLFSELSLTLEAVLQCPVLMLPSCAFTDFLLPS